MKLYTTDEDFIKEVEDFPLGYTGMIEDQSGNKRWYVEGIIHRDNDLPAMIYKNGNQLWFFYGKRHRVGAPAEILVAKGIFADAVVLNTTRWYVGGKLHRLDGPAVEPETGENQWYLDGELHRQDGPATTYFKNNKANSCWLVHGKKHRLDGPAIVYEDFAFGPPEGLSENRIAEFKMKYQYKLDVLDTERNLISYTEEDIKIRVDGTKAVELWFVDNKKVTEEACKLLRDMIRLKGLPNEKNK